jgi:hypothetical protein
VTQPDTDRLANELAEADTSVIVFASSTGKQISKEDKRGRAFTSALIEGIEVRRLYKDWHVSIAELECGFCEVKKLTRQSDTVPPPSRRPWGFKGLSCYPKEKRRG